jgi:predicted anti-sigma-YlaC factor YlaD
MKHEQAQEFVNLYLDEGLTDDRSAQMFEHLGTCNECRNFMQTSLRIRSYYQQMELSDAPSSLDRRIAVSIGTARRENQRTNFFLPLWTTRLSIPVPVAASILFLILVGSLLISPILYQKSQYSGGQQTERLSRIPPELQQQLQLFR